MSIIGSLSTLCGAAEVLCYGTAVLVEQA